MSIQIRNYRESDLPLIVVLLNAVEAVDRMEQGTSLEEMREESEMPGLNPEANVYVAEDEDGRLIGRAALEMKHEPEESGFRTRLHVHPMFRGRGVEDRLLARLEERAMERIGEAKTDKVYFACIVGEGNDELIRAFERAGMKEIRRFWTMVRPSLDDLPSTSFPAGLIARSYLVGDDDAEALDAHNDAFSEHFGHAPDSLEWIKFYVGSSTYRPDLTVVAVDPKANQIAGYCHIMVNEGECRRIGRRRGWMDILGVRKPYRHHGLGEALILEGMHNLRKAGLQEAALGCDSENTTGATRLYFRVGFRVHRTWIAFDKYLRSSAEETKSETLVAVQV